MNPRRGECASLGRGFWVAFFLTILLGLAQVLHVRCGRKESFVEERNAVRAENGTRLFFLNSRDK
jgi:hypothetical protein